MTSSTQDELAGIKYCPGKEIELLKYSHMDYKGGSSRRWQVQYQHCAGRAREVLSIPRGEVKDVSLEQDDVEMWSRKESWSTVLEEVRRLWRSKQEGKEEKNLLPTGRRMGDRRASQEE